MNKRNLLLFAGIIIFLVIFVLVLFFQQNQQPPNPSSLQGQNPANLHTSGGQNVGSQNLPPLSTDPKAATKQFYQYYITAHGNPLADGAYKTNPYLSKEFKNVVGALYNNGNSTLFCSQNEKQNVTVGKSQQIPYNDSYLVQEVITDAATGGKDLYRVSLENNNGQWSVFDVNCIY